MTDEIEKQISVLIAERVREFHESPRDVHVESVQRILKKWRDLSVAIVGVGLGADDFEVATYQSIGWSKLAAQAKNKKERTEWTVSFDDERFPTGLQAIWISLYRDIEAVHAYGVFGIGDAALVLHEDYTEELISNEFGPTALAKKLPADWVVGTPLHQIFEAADARAAIDGLSEAESVSVLGLAALAGVEHKTLQNILSPSSRSSLKKIGNGIEKGRVRTGDAKRWLATQKKFRPTINSADASVDAAVDKQVRPFIDPKHVRFVPVAKDGSRFDSSLKVDGGYWVGEKGSEEQFRSYDGALNALQRMRWPTWRRLDSAGRARFVTGVTWDRINKCDLDQK